MFLVKNYSFFSSFLPQLILLALSIYFYFSIIMKSFSKFYTNKFLSFNFVFYMLKCRKKIIWEKYMKKILIFYASYGGGHLSAANSIKQYIDENYTDYEIKLVDCMLYVNKPINKISTTAYKEMAKKFPWAWGEVYSHSQKGPLAHISNASNKLMAKKLLCLLNEYHPDIVISTHPFGSQMVSYLKQKNLTSCKLATIMTDFAPHEQWLVGNEYTDYIFVSHEKMKQEISISNNIPESKIFATGIPLSNRFLRHYNKKTIMENFLLNPEKKVIIFFGGGEFGLGREKTLKILKAFIQNL